jgi:hypothetical protein
MVASEIAYLVQWVLATELRLGGAGVGAGSSDAAAAAAAAASDRAEALAQAAADRVGAALLERGSAGAGGAAGGAGGGDGAAEAVAEPATVALAPAVVLPFQVARLKARLAEKRDWCVAARVM